MGPGGGKIENGQDAEESTAERQVQRHESPRDINTSPGHVAPECMEASEEA